MAVSRASADTRLKLRPPDTPSQKITPRILSPASDHCEIGVLCGRFLSFPSTITSYPGGTTLSAANTIQPLTLEEISEHVRTHIGQWLAEESLAKPPAVYEIELRERMIRLEEELKNQRELIKQGFDLMEKRFEAVDRRFEAMSAENNKRFEAMSVENNKRFEAMSTENNKRFEAIDRRFEAMSAENNKRFEAMSAENNRRFEAMSAENNKRFEAIDRRFEAMSAENNQRFEALTKRIDRLMYWSLGITVGTGSLVVAALKVLL
uniref:DUF1640 domain-containing protein n=1 Tax=Candidatus Kentrum sp. FW TaxID=2126338 RepID=A0A450T3E5_9GAMM|nr:MAG: hypothetical protein BECKFW1821A_GA0114235_10052 [Candidatus Kentron sp. FW]VFJ60807.1 MAG: hypothetical protein BECKFW1821B_GA0114236_10602 [Candidatus Kentron sp. FW]